MSCQITENCLKMHEKLTWDSPRFLINSLEKLKR